MAGTIGAQQQATFVTPVEGGPLDASVVLGNDNNVRTKHNAHDSDPTIHVQSSSLATRPAAGTAQRVWVTTDGFRAYVDDGANWQEIAYLPVAGGTVTGTAVFTTTVKIGTLSVTGAAFAQVLGAVSLSATSATLVAMASPNVTATSLTATNALLATANVTSLTATAVTTPALTSTSLTATSAALITANITSLTATLVTTPIIVAGTATLTSAAVVTANVTSLTATAITSPSETITTSNITTLTATVEKVITSNVTSLTATAVTTPALTATTGNVNTLTATTALTVGGGTLLKSIQIISVSLTPTPITAAAANSKEMLFTQGGISNIATTDVIFVSKPSQTTFVTVGGARVAGAGTIGITFGYGITTVTPVGELYTILAVRS